MPRQLLRRRPSLCDWDAPPGSADGGISEEAQLVSEKCSENFSDPSVMQRSWGEPAREKDGVGSTPWLGGSAGRPGPMSSNAGTLQGPKMANLDAERGIRLDPQPGGRAALPTSHSNRSQSSFRQTDPLGNGASANVAQSNNQPDEFAWGPFHPCFPHPNPHVPLSSPLFASTRIIRVKRDWMIAGDLAPTFSNLYPEILDPIFPEEQFRKVIGKLNSELIEIFNPWTARNWADIVMGALTFWLWDDLGMSGVKRRLFALESWIERWNIEVGAKEGVRIIPLRRTAFMTVCERERTKSPSPCSVILRHCSWISKYPIHNLIWMLPSRILVRRPRHNRSLQNPSIRIRLRCSRSHSARHPIRSLYPS